MSACYLLGVCGYSVAMALSLAGHVPAGLVVLCAASLAAIVLFRARST